MFTELVNSDKAAGRFRRYKIIFTPQKVTSDLRILLKYANSFILQSDCNVMTFFFLQFYACETVLEEQGVYGGWLSVLNFSSFVNSSPNADIKYDVLSQM